MNLSGRNLLKLKTSMCGSVTQRQHGHTSVHTHNPLNLPQEQLGRLSMEVAGTCSGTAEDRPEGHAKDTESGLSRPACLLHHPILLPPSYPVFSLTVRCSPDFYQAPVLVLGDDCQHTLLIIH